ncbi:MAB_1171c family putative transporter [Gordonia sp. (in: high G+C Gram-positive bacteria)]|uniref:MAB_1171c family putative transporter n=1 Tax=Gordonia sp. (in: high G+C Gram-positive bacteria) TaxID=84139 RepID=UPI0039E53398
MTGILSADVVNFVALLIFTVAVIWRMDQIRRYGGGLQAAAMTASIVAFTLAFVAANPAVARRLNDGVFDGFARVVLWCMLAVGVAALIVVFYYDPATSARARRAGIEAIPLVIAAVGLQVAMSMIPHELRLDDLNGSTAKDWAFATFFLIGSIYLTYGFASCVRSIRQFLPAAAGYLRTSLVLLILGLLALAAAAFLQIVFILGVMTHWFVAPALLTATHVLVLIGMVGFLLGISYPLIHSRVRWVRARLTLRQQYRDLEPLWEVVTTAVPGVVLPGKDGAELDASTMVMFNRRVVEIRDALTQLSPLVPEDFADSSPERQGRLITAAARKYARKGEAPGQVRDLLPAGAATLIGDAEPLREVSLTLTRGARWVKS